MLHSPGQTVQCSEEVQKSQALHLSKTEKAPAKGAQNGIGTNHLTSATE